MIALTVVIAPVIITIIARLIVKVTTVRPSEVRRQWVVRKVKLWIFLLKSHL